MSPIRTYTDVRARCIRKTAPQGVAGECLEWQGAVDRNGHPRAKVSGVSTYIRRWVFERTHGYLPQVVGAVCGNVLCCYRAHLIPSSYAELEKRKPPMTVMRVIGRASALKSPRAVLSLDDARAIRADSRPAKQIAADYGISWAHAKRVKRGDRWAEPPSALNHIAEALGGLAA